MALLAFGAIVPAAEQVGAELDLTVVNMRFVRPLDRALLLELARDHDGFVTLEDNVVAGGAGSGVAELLAAEGIGLPVTVFGDNPDDTHDLLSMLGPPPHIIKLNEGAQGAGVMLTEKPSASRSPNSASFASISDFAECFSDFCTSRMQTIRSPSPDSPGKAIASSTASPAKKCDFPDPRPPWAPL